MQTDSDTNPDTELLTAYLDNELDPSQRAAVEARLVNEESLRLDLRRLRRAWDLLDAWPDPIVSRDFASSTMRLIAQNIEQHPAQATPQNSVTAWVDRIMRGIRHKVIAVPLIVFGIASGLAAGYFGRSSQKDEQWLRLATASVYPTLRAFRSMDVPTQLSSFPKLDELKQTDIAKSTLPQPPSDVTQLQDWLDRLDPKDKELLRVRDDDFRRLNTEDQTKYVQQWQSSAAIENSAAVQETATIFAALLQSMPSGKRTEILALPQAEQVKRLTDEAYFKIAMSYSDRLSPEDSATISRWAEQDLFPLIGDLHQVLGWLAWNGDFDDLRRIKNQEELMNLLISRLSEDAQSRILPVTGKHRGTVLANWLVVTEGFGRSFGPVNVDEMVKTYNGLDFREKEFVDLRQSWMVPHALEMMRKGKKMQDRMNSSPQATDTSSEPKQSEEKKSYD
jgi:hypothetical protein